jgi:hypothetical protein
MSEQSRAQHLTPESAFARWGLKSSFCHAMLRLPKCRPVKLAIQNMLIESMAFCKRGELNTKTFQSLLHSRNVLLTRAALGSAEGRLHRLISVRDVEPLSRIKAYVMELFWDDPKVVQQLVALRAP